MYVIVYTHHYHVHTEGYGTYTRSVALIYTMHYHYTIAIPHYTIVSLTIDIANTEAHYSRHKQYHHYNHADCSISCDIYISTHHYIQYTPAPLHLHIWVSLLYIHHTTQATNTSIAWPLERNTPIEKVRQTCEYPLNVRVCLR